MNEIAPPRARPPRGRRVTSLRAFLANEAAGGLVLMGVALLALVVANSPLSTAYFALLKYDLLGLSVLHWINDGLMAVFFLLVGLEIKREMLQGQLRTWPDRALPGIAALGGMLVPAGIYVALNWGAPQTLRGWAIPSATDIAFALGVLALLGPRVPVSLKVFLTALAVLDDLGAVAIIALFYTAALSWPYLAAALIVVGLLRGLAAFGIHRLWPYLALGAVLWFLVLKSGVHATIAGVVLALMIPIRARPGDPARGEPPLARLEHAIQPWVAFAIVPVFGFANAGVSFAGVSAETLLQPLPLGLFLGKQLGVFAFSWAVIRAGLADLPAHASWPQLYGVALLCGIGFTMSLVIGLLAFPSAPQLQDGVKMGVLAGSLLSAVAGATLLRIIRPEPRRTELRRLERCGSERRDQ